MEVALCTPLSGGFCRGPPQLSSACVPPCPLRWGSPDAPTSQVIRSWASITNHLLAFEESSLEINYHSAEGNNYILVPPPLHCVNVCLQVISPLWASVFLICKMGII